MRLTIRRRFGWRQQRPPGRRQSPVPSSHGWARSEMTLVIPPAGASACCRWQAVTNTGHGTTGTRPATALNISGPPPAGCAASPGCAHHQQYGQWPRLLTVLWLTFFGLDCGHPRRQRSPLSEDLPHGWPAPRPRCQPAPAASGRCVKRSRPGIRAGVDTMGIKHHGKGCSRRPVRPPPPPPIDPEAPPLLSTIAFWPSCCDSGCARMRHLIDRAAGENTATSFDRLVEGPNPCGGRLQIGTAAGQQAQADGEGTTNVHAVSMM